MVLRSAVAAVHFHTLCLSKPVLKVVVRSTVARVDHIFSSMLLSIEYWSVCMMEHLMNRDKKLTLSCMLGCKDDVINWIISMMI